MMATERTLETIVIKVGSARAVQNETRTRLAQVIAQLHQLGKHVVLVSSGAIACGLAGGPRPQKMSELQAAAAIGQLELMQHWQLALAPTRVAQLLLTHHDVTSRQRFVNARHTLRVLLDRDVVPIINENDSVAFDEIRFGDNDMLAAQVAAIVSADILVLLSNADGLQDGGGRVVAQVKDIAKEAMPLVRNDKSTLGTGGMQTKLQAAQVATSLGVPVLLVGNAHAIGAAIVDGQSVGTLFHAQEGMQARRHWLTFSAKASAQIRVDAGAKTAISQRLASVLPSGIVGVNGTFARGDVISLVGPDGAVFARGIAAYSADAVMRIIGRQSSQIADLLGYDHGSEVIHRDDLVLT